MKAIKCSFCEANIPHLDEKAIDEGWGKVIGRIGRREINIVWCPKCGENLSERIISMFPKK
jgi:hypothetical protein